MEGVPQFGGTEWTSLLNKLSASFLGQQGQSVNPSRVIKGGDGGLAGSRTLCYLVGLSHVSVVVYITLGIG